MHSDEWLALLTGDMFIGHKEVEHKEEQGEDHPRRSLHRAILLRHKLAFVFGVLNLSFTAFLIGRAPHWFGLWHTPKAIFLLCYRFIKYKQTRAHYYLLEFCYYANLLILYWLWFNPRTLSPYYVTAFIFANGPLLIAVALFRNSLVFHSSDKMTSVFLHASAALLSWTTRWYPGPKQCSLDIAAPALPQLGLDNPVHVFTLPIPFCQSEVNVPAEMDAITADFGFSDVYTKALWPWWFFWSIPFYTWVLVLRWKRMNERNYDNVYISIAKKETHPLKNLFNKITYNPLAHKVMYMAFHCCLVAVTVPLGYFSLNSFWFHTAYICTILTICCWNGSTFYFDVFAVRYRQQLEKQFGPAPQQKKKE